MESNRPCSRAGLASHEALLGLMNRKQDGPGLIITKTRPPEPGGGGGTAWVLARALRGELALRLCQQMK